LRSIELTPLPLIVPGFQAIGHVSTDTLLLHRITRAGDVPVGLDGRSSAVRKGDASRFSPVVEPVGAVV
jgi:hypothetical protein